MKVQKYLWMVISSLKGKFSFIFIPKNFYLVIICVLWLFPWTPLMDLVVLTRPDHGLSEHGLLFLWFWVKIKNKKRNRGVPVRVNNNRYSRTFRWLDNPTSRVNVITVLYGILPSSINIGLLCTSYSSVIGSSKTG